MHSEPSPPPAGEGVTQSFVPTQRDPAAAPDTERWLRRALFGSVIAIYVLAFPYHPALRSPNELCRLWQTRALVDFGTIELNQAIRTWGYVGDLSRMNGKLYPSKAPLLSFADVPVYWVLKGFYGSGTHDVPELALVFWSRLVLTVLPTLLMLVLVRRFLRAFLSPRTADGLTAAYALGTLALSYSLLFMSHQSTAVLIFAAFYALWRTLRGDWTGARGKLGVVLAGALAAATVAAEYTGALPVIAVIMYAVLAVLMDGTRGWGGRIGQLGLNLALACVGASPFVAFLFWYHSTAFGGPLETGYKHLNDAGYQPWHMGGFLGIRYPDPRAFVLSFFSPLRGLFTLSPFLIFGPFGAFLLHRRIKEARRAETPGPFTPAADRAMPHLVWLLLAGYTYFTSSFSYDSWGWTTGPRHLTALVPFLLLPVGLVIDGALRGSGASRIVAGIAAALSAGAVIVTGALSFVNYIPDSTSNAFFGLAVRLFGDGYLPPGLIGGVLPNPYSGGLMLALLAMGAACVFAVLVPLSKDQKRAAMVPALAGLGVLFVYFSVLAAATRHDRNDDGAYAHLRAVWLQPPGKTISFGGERSPE